MDVNIKVFLKFPLHPKNREKKVLYFLAQKTVVKIKISLFFSQNNSREYIYIYFKFYLPLKRSWK